MANKRKPRRDYWWQFAERASGMRRATASLPEVLAIARVSKTVMPLRVPTGQVFHEKVVVFATDSYAVQAILSSSVHQLWAIKYGTTMRTDATYTPDLVFGSLPRPHATDLLAAAGRTLDAERAAVMMRRGVGLTKLYNLVNDPEDSRGRDIERLRAIHVEVDEAALDAYGWSDIDPAHGFYSYRQAMRWTVKPAARIEILDRLLEENLRRAHMRHGGGPTASSARLANQGALFG